MTHDNIPWVTMSLKFSLNLYNPTVSCKIVKTFLLNFKSKKYMMVRFLLKILCKMKIERGKGKWNRQTHLLYYECWYILGVKRLGWATPASMHRRLGPPLAIDYHALVRQSSKISCFTPYYDKFGVELNITSWIRAFILQSVF